MGDLNSSVSPHSCHCTQRAGVASSTTENKHSSTQTTDIWYRRDKSSPRLPARLADTGSPTSRSAGFTRAASETSYFSPPSNGTSDLLNVNMFEAGREGDREADEGPLKGPVCVCVCWLAPG